MISQSEIVYIQDGIKQGIRTDGRGCDALRPMTIDLGVVPTANGSCRVRSKACDVFVAIKCEIGVPDSVKPDQGIVNVSVEFGCSVIVRVSDMSGRQSAIESETWADVLANQVQSMCLQSVDLKHFCIESKRACWVVSIDILVERVDGPLIDPISVGIRAAMMNLELPIVSLPPPEEENGSELFPKVDLVGGLWKLKPENMSAICVSVGVFCDSTVIVVDLDRTEETLAKSANNSLITLSVTEDSKCFGIHKWGTGVVDPTILQSLISSASLVGKQIGSIMTKLVAAA